METISIPKELVASILQVVSQVPSSIGGHVWVELGKVLEAEAEKERKNNQKGTK